MTLDELREDGALSLHEAMAQMIPVDKGAMPVVVVHAFADVPTELEIELRVAGSGKNYTPEKVLEKKKLVCKKAVIVFSLPGVSSLNRLNMPILFF
jgi:hypothetical protein